LETVAEQWLRRNFSQRMTQLPQDIGEWQSRARAWFERLRNELCDALEKVEADLPAAAPLGDGPPCRFVRTPS
jgi:coproporphyrinogen III oxidase